MKIKSTIYIIAVLAIAFTTSANAQLTAKAAVNVTFVTPLSLAVTTPMSFGNLISTVGSQSQAQLNADGNYNIIGALTLHSGSGTPAEITVTADANTQFHLTLPNSNTQIYFTSDAPGANTDISLVAIRSEDMMGMDNYTTDGSGVKVIKIGSILNIPANTTVVPATYYIANGGFEVSVNYM